MHHYFVFEIQVYADGTASNLAFSFTNRLEAEAKYHSILSYAAMSDIPRHTAALMDDEGVTYMSKCYENETEPDNDQ